MYKPYANMNREELIDEVMDVTKSTITDADDWTALEKLLTFVPTEKLRGFLPEEDPAEDNENEISNAYFNALDLQRTISSNGLDNIKRVHGGTDNEDTMKDLIDDLVSFLTGILPEENDNG